jgi:hypothetical protein
MKHYLQAIGLIFIIFLSVFFGSTIINYKVSALAKANLFKKGIYIGSVWKPFSIFGKNYNYAEVSLCHKQRT